MIVPLAYGRGSIPVEFPDSATVIEPSPLPPLADERAALFEALNSPIGAAPLREQSAREARFASSTLI